MKRSISLSMYAVILTGLLIAGCAVDRSELATPESMRDLPPPPEVVETSYCDDVPADTGQTAITTTPLTFPAAEDVLEPDAVDYYACMVTNKGVVELTLFDDNAPETVNNFVFLAQQGFYDGVAFHRVVDDFVVQGGDRNGVIEGRAGTGGPGYQWPDELGALALPHNSAGNLSMANAGPNTNGSQFFITLTADCCTHLNGQHAVFGQVSGAGDMDIVLDIVQGDFMQAVRIVEVDADSDEVLTMSEPPVIEEADTEEADTEDAVTDEAEAGNILDTLGELDAAEETDASDGSASATTVSYCDNVPADTGMTTLAEETLSFDEAEDVLEPDTLDYRACMVTSKGVIELDLFDDEAPETVNNFVFLAQQGFYDGVAFHRVVDSFVIQGGDRNGVIEGRAGAGGPGYQWADEPAALGLPHDRAGILSMANAGPDTNGSQFFVTLTDDCCTHLNGLHAVFGVAVESIDVVDSITQGDLIQTVIVVEIDPETGEVVGEALDILGTLDDLDTGDSE